MTEHCFDRKIIKDKKRGIYLLSVGRILKMLDAMDWEIVRIYAKRIDEKTIELRMVRVL